VAAASSSSGGARGLGGLSSAEETGFDIWMRHNVNEPLLAWIPYAVTPNSLSLANTAACWLAYLFGFYAYKYEHVYPSVCMWLRFAMSGLIFASIILDCLDGMHARATGRTSKLGELLDHSLDSANIPLLAAAVLVTIHPDIYTVLISVIGGSMIYNAQLVIYRHHNVFVLPPVTGPTAQGMVSAAVFAFAIFFRLVNRHAYMAQLFIMAFAVVGNITQFQNTVFYTKHLLRAPGTLGPHLRFSATMIAHAVLPLAGWISQSEYLLSAAILAYRLNGRYVLDTLQQSKQLGGGGGGRDHLRVEDTEWRWECVGALLALILIASTTHASSAMHHSPTVVAVLGIPLVSLSLFHMAFYAFMAMCVALNVRDLMAAMPALTAK
jgi:phosphatidylglycerophosphate synthase